MFPVINQQITGTRILKCTSLPRFLAYTNKLSKFSLFNYTVYLLFKSSWISGQKYILGYTFKKNMISLSEHNIFCNPAEHCTTSSSSSSLTQTSSSFY